MAARIRQTDSYLRTAAGRDGLEAITVGTGFRFGGSDHDASSSRGGTRAHVWLGLLWFHPDTTEGQPAIWRRAR